MEIETEIEKDILLVKVYIYINLKIVEVILEFLKDINLDFDYRVS